MAFELDKVKARVKALSQDDAPFLTDPEINEAVAGAIQQVSHDRPFRKVKDIPGDGTQDLPLPSDFQRGFSDIESVESPAGENPVIFRDRDDDWTIYEDPTKPVGSQLRLRFRETTPSTTDVLTSLDVDTILFQSGNTIRYTFNGTPDLSGVKVAHTLTVATATKSSNNGDFVILAVNDVSDFVDVLNETRSDNTDDEASDSPAVGTIRNAELVRVIIQSPHTVTLSTSTLDTTSFLGVVYMSLVNIFRSLAARFGETTDPTIDADAVDYSGRTQNYLFISERWKTQYKGVIGKDAAGVTAAQSTGDFDIRTITNEDFLFHPKRRR